MHVRVAEASVIAGISIEPPDRETIRVIFHPRSIVDGARAKISDAREMRTPRQRQEFPLFIYDASPGGVPATASRVSQIMMGRIAGHATNRRPRTHRMVGYGTVHGWTVRRVMTCRRSAVGVGRHGGERRRCKRSEHNAIFHGDLHTQWPPNTGQPIWLTISAPKKLPERLRCDIAWLQPGRGSRQARRFFAGRSKR